VTGAPVHFPAAGTWRITRKRCGKPFLKVYWLGGMPVFIKYSELNQYKFKNTFLDGSSPHAFYG
jgi:hypothetical protein